MQINLTPAERDEVFGGTGLDNDGCFGPGTQNISLTMEQLESLGPEKLEILRHAYHRPLRRMVEDAVIQTLSNALPNFFFRGW